MGRITALLLLFLTLTACATRKPTTSAKEYWSQAPDLSKITYEGGDGKSLASSIVIKNAENSRNGIAAEYEFIAKAHGEKFKDWKPIGQSSIVTDGKRIDMIKVLLLASNDTLTYYFDITDFYGKF